MGGGSIPSTILDIGCSNGDFLYYLGSIYPNASLSGADILSELLDKVKYDFKMLNMSIPTLYHADIVSGIGLPQSTFDIVFLNGVIGIFDDLHNPIRNFSRLISDNGVGYIWASFNNYDLDVFNKVKVKNSSHAESGWNIWSKSTVLSICEKYGLCGVYHNFCINIDLNETGDPLRSWTIKLEDGSRCIINGMGIIHNFSLLELRKMM